MSESQRPPFHFWRFFFSLRGRVSRVPFAAFMLPVKAFFFFAVTAAEHSFLATRQDLTLIFLGVLKWLITWPSLALTFKRLHDCNLPGLMALVIFSPAVVNAIQTINEVIAIHHGAAPNVSSVLYNGASNAFFYGLWIFALGLALFPGSKGPNRFGPDPRQQASPADAF